MGRGARGARESGKLIGLFAHDFGEPIEVSGHYLAERNDSGRLASEVSRKVFRGKGERHNRNAIVTAPIDAFPVMLRGCEVESVRFFQNESAISRRKGDGEGTFVIGGISAGLEVVGMAKRGAGAEGPFGIEVGEEGVIRWA